MTVAALGLGGNIGDAAAAMARALRELDAHGDCRLMAVSNLYRTPPWGKTDQADFSIAALWSRPRFRLQRCWNGASISKKA